METMLKDLKEGRSVKLFVDPVTGERDYFNSALARYAELHPAAPKIMCAVLDELLPLIVCSMDADMFPGAVTFHTHDNKVDTYVGEIPEGKLKPGKFGVVVTTTRDRRTITVMEQGRAVTTIDAPMCQMVVIETQKAQDRAAAKAARSARGGGGGGGGGRDRGGREGRGGRGGRGGGGGGGGGSSGVSSTASKGFPAWSPWSR
jgi:hypothetical protein